MIQSDTELEVTRKRVSYLLNLLTQLRVSSRPEELALVSGGYRAQVERMQREVLDYLTQPAMQTAKKPVQPYADCFHVARTPPPAENGSRSVN